MIVKHMDAHPTIAGVVWDANGKFREDQNQFVPRYIPDPRHSEEFTGPESITLFNSLHPAIAHAQAIWGQTDEEQWTNSNLWQVAAFTAGVEF